MDAIYIFLIVLAIVLVILIVIIIFIRKGFFKDVDIVPKSQRYYSVNSRDNMDYLSYVEISKKPQQWQMEADIQILEHQIKQDANNNKFDNEKIAQLENMRREFTNVSSSVDVQRARDKFQKDSKFAKKGKSYFINSDALLAFRIEPESYSNET
jgi:hypothetical protein